MSNSPNSNKYDLLFTGLQVLIIDDDVQLCESLKFYFEDQESIVAVANDGRTGIQLFLSQRFDVVVVDLNMPNIDGHQVISYISRNSPDTPLIVVSGTGEIDNAIRAIQLGAWDFITKPILNFDVLELSLHRALEKVQLIEENKAYKANLEKLVERRTIQLEEKTRELERSHSEMRLAKIKAENADKLKTEFLSQVSHEIRTPINSIISFTSLIKSEAVNCVPEDLRDGFTIIERSGERIIRTIDLLIDMSQVISGSYEKRIVKIDLVEVLETLIYEHKQKIKKDLEIKLDSKLEECCVYLDHYSFVQILNNIIDNSIKFTSTGSINISLCQTDSETIISIKDTGIGMKENYIEDIFTPFSQEEHGYSRSYEGNGLGMALVKYFCDLNDIEISIHSVKYEGTTVSLRIKSHNTR